MDSSYPPYYAYPSAPPLRRALPQPPRLHWGWVLALSVLTFGLFSTVWLFVQANWIRKMRGGKSTAFWVALVNLLWLPVVFVMALGAGVLAAVMPSAAGSVSLLGPLVRIGSLILYAVAVYTMRSEMEAEPIDLSLSGVMTFLFGPLYFQYNLSDYGTPQETGTGLSLSQSATLPVAPGQPAAYPTPAEVGVVYPPAPEAPPPRSG